MYFDKKTYSTLKKIYDSGDTGILWGDLRPIFGSDGLYEMLDMLNQEEYTVNKDETGNFIKFEHQHYTSDRFRAFCSPKGGALIWERQLAFRRWIVPTVISILALIISIVTLLFTIWGNDILRVMIIP